MYVEESGIDVCVYISLSYPWTVCEKSFESDRMYVEKVKNGRKIYVW